MRGDVLAVVQQHVGEEALIAAQQGAAQQRFGEAHGSILAGERLGVGVTALPKQRGELALVTRRLAGPLVHRQFVFTPGAVGTDPFAQGLLQVADLVVAPVGGSERALQRPEPVGDGGNLAIRW